MPYLLIELFYIGLPVVRTDGQAVGRTYGHVITKFSRMGRLLNFLKHGAPLRARELRYEKLKRRKYDEYNFCIVEMNFLLLLSGFFYFVSCYKFTISRRCITISR